jgi:hypothetical protein
MKIFDKAQWHIDAGENETEVVTKFRKVFSFLKNQNMLSKEGEEILSFGIDSSISLNEQMVSEAGYIFLDKHYDDAINCKSDTITATLEQLLSQD